MNSQNGTECEISAVEQVFRLSKAHELEGQIDEKCKVDSSDSLCHAVSKSSLKYLDVFGPNTTRAYFGSPGHTFNSGVIPPKRLTNQ